MTARKLRYVPEPSSFEPEPEDVLYLDIEDVFDLYADWFHCSPQAAEDQLRGGGRDLLESALARPRTYARYQGADLALQAAVLAEGIAEHQPFIEGNKRMAEATYREFLLLNGYEIEASDEERARWITRLSAPLSSEDLIEELARHIRRSAVMVTES